MNMAESPITSFLETLQNVRGAGRFWTIGSFPFIPPGIVLKNGDDLALPLSRAQAAELRQMMGPAPYGMGAETRLDTSVRQCRQVDTADLAWNSPKWSAAVAKVVDKIADDLGVEGRVKAQPYKLL